MQTTSILLLLTLLLWVSGLCDGAAEFEATGCAITLNFTEPPDPKLLPVAAPSRELKQLESFLGLASIVLGFIPAGGRFLTSSIAFTRVMVGLSGESGASTEEIVNKMSSDMVWWTKEMVAHQLAKSAVKDMEDELAVLVDALKRVERYGHTPDGYSELTALHRRYLDHWRRFFPHFPQPEQSYYENIMGLIQTYCVSGCQHARADLNSAYHDVTSHVALLQELLDRRVVPALQARYFGQPFVFEANLQAMQRSSWSGPPLRGQHDHTYQGTKVSMRWYLQSKWVSLLVLDVQCEHQLSAAFTCRAERKTFPEQVLAMRDRQWPIYNGGIRCLRKLEAFTQQYRSGPMEEVRRFIQDAVVEYIKVLRNASGAIAQDRSATDLWLSQRLKA
ncbi:hypothetical protein RI367_003887 [Sorochytrium milnesiophthora]